jgi:hypothetical protein
MVNPSQTIYATLDDVKRYAFRSGIKDDPIQEDVLLRASRIIDRYCEVPDGYFAPFADQPTVATVIGNGTQYLRVDRYAPGTIASVLAADGRLAPEYSEVDGYLVALHRCVWELGRPYEVTAKWGFLQTPPDIAEATIELAIALWRQRDGAFLRVVGDVNTGLGSISGQALPERVKLICERWRRKQPVVFA